MTPEKDPKIIAAKLCEFARTNFVAEGVEFDENSPLSEAGIDSFALVELVLFCERVLGVRVPAYSSKTKTGHLCIAIGRLGSSEHSLFRQIARCRRRRYATLRMPSLSVSALFRKFVV